MAQVAKAGRIAGACIAMCLAGCAGAPDPERSAETCDLICHVIRLFEEEPPPPPMRLMPPLPRKSRVRAEGSRRTAGRVIHERHRNVMPASLTAAAPASSLPDGPLRAGSPPNALRPTDPAATPDEDQAAVEAPDFPTMRGSNAIAPPWFEPWRPR